MASVDDIPNSELVRRAVFAAKAVSRGGQPRWVAVQELFALGSTYAQQLCRRYGLDPDEKVRRQR